MNLAESTLDQLDVITARSYGERGYPHEAWARLRREDPVHLFHPAGYRPFWAITKHADITEISTQPEKFRSAGRFILMPDPPDRAPEKFEDEPPLRMLVNMDPPEHRDYRKLVGKWFTPRAIARLETRLEEITAEIFDDLARDGGVYEAEFVRQVAALQPLRMITEILGIPREQEEFVLRVTNENFGIEDPEFQRPGESTADRLGFLQEAFAFLDEITQERRRQPRNDLSTVLAQATINGQPVPQFDLFSLYFVFRLDRNPNPHLGFGVGEHFCLGAHLARLDLKVFFRQLAERLESIELAGPVERLHASFVGGPKRLPVRYRLRPR